MGYVFLAALFLALAGWYVWSQRRLSASGHRPRASVPDHRPGHDFHGPRVAASGGWRVGTQYASIPLVTLAADDRWVRLRQRAAVRWVGRSEVWIERTDDVVVRPVAGAGSRGVMWATPTGRYDAIVFWSVDPDDVAAKLRQFGWRTDGFDPLR